jgi:hypothetical protein
MVMCDRSPDPVMTALRIEVMVMRLLELFVGTVLRRIAMVLVVVAFDGDYRFGELRV